MERDRADIWSNAEYDDYLSNRSMKRNSNNVGLNSHQSPSLHFRQESSHFGLSSFAGNTDLSNRSPTFTNNFMGNPAGRVRQSTDYDYGDDYDNAYDDEYDSNPTWNNVNSTVSPRSMTGGISLSSQDRSHSAINRDILGYPSGGRGSVEESFTPAERNQGFPEPFFPGNYGPSKNQPFRYPQYTANPPFNPDLIQPGGHYGYPQTHNQSVPYLSQQSFSSPQAYVTQTNMGQYPLSGHIMAGRHSMYGPPARGLIAPPRPPMTTGPHYLMPNIRGPQSGLSPSPPTLGSSGSPTPGTGGSNAQGRAINKMLLDVLKNRIVDPNRLALIVDANIERMDCVNLATLLFHTGKKRLVLTPSFIKRIATRFSLLKEELRAREASNALYGLKCMSSDSPDVRQLVLALAHKVSLSQSDLVAQAVGNAIYGCQMMTSEHEEVRFLLQVLAVKVTRCTELLEAQNVGNALYGLRGMNSDFKEVRMLLSALTPKIATAKEELNGQALGNSLYGLQCMSAKESEVRNLLSVLADKAKSCWENLKAQEVGNLLYGLKRMNSDIPEVRNLIDAIVPKIEASPEILDAQAIGNSFYGMQNMKSDNSSVLSLLKVMAEKVTLSVAELDGQAMGNSLYGLQGMKSEFDEVRLVVKAITTKLDSSSLEMNAQELGNALYGLQNMTSDFPEVRSLLVALARKVASSKHDLTSQEIGNALYGLQGMRSDTWETRLLVRQLSMKISRSTTLLDPQGIANSLYGFQRMSSESEEVRLLIQALSVKIDQSWKLLNAQHVANAIYGLQNLSSFEMEVSSLVRSLVQKVITCRDEMTSKQISCAFFGLQNMYSRNDDVIALVVALTEKVSLSKDAMTGLQLGSALFGLQGLDDSSMEVRKLIAAFTTKITNNIKDVDPVHLGNCFYGLQRMSTQSPEVCDLLRVLVPIGVSLAAKRLEFNSKVCGNILYGLQNCSWQNSDVLDMMRLLNDYLNTYASNCLQSLEFGRNNLEINIDDIMSLYQSLTLGLSCYPDTYVDMELKDNFKRVQSVLMHVIENRKHEKTFNFVRSMSIPQIRICEGIRILLDSEPYEVSSGELLWGFETTALVSLKQEIKLTTTLGEMWNPILNIEILGSSHTFPSKDLLTRLRNRYLFEEKGIHVEMIHASMVASASFGKGQYAKKGMIDTLRSQDSLFQALYPPTIEDATLFANILYSQGFTGPQGLMSSLIDVSTEQLIENYRLRNESNRISNSNSFFAIGTLDTSSQAFDGFNGVTSYEYIDDNLENDGLGYNRRIPNIDIRSPWRVMNEKWIGDHPKISSPMNLQSPRGTPATTPQGNSNRGNVFNFSMVSSSTSNTTVQNTTNYSSGLSSVGLNGNTGTFSMKNISATSLNAESQYPADFDNWMSSQPSLLSNKVNAPTIDRSLINSLTLSTDSNAPMLSEQLTLTLPLRAKGLSPSATVFHPTTTKPELSFSGTDETSDVDTSPTLLQSPSETLLANVGGSSSNSEINSIPSDSGNPKLISYRSYHSVGKEGISPMTNIEDGGDEATEGEVTDEIALLEAQLEVARIEAKLLQLKKTCRSSGNSTTGSKTGGSGSSPITLSEAANAVGNTNRITGAPVDESA